MQVAAASRPPNNQIETIMNICNRAAHGPQPYTLGYVNRSATHKVPDRMNVQQVSFTPITDVYALDPLLDSQPSGRPLAPGP